MENLTDIEKKYKEGKLSDQELRTLYDRLENDSQFREEFIFNKDILIASEYKMNSYSYNETDEWNGLTNKLSNNKVNSTYILSKKIIKYIAAAACLFLAFLMGVLSDKPETTSNSAHIYRTPRGHRSFVELPDGSTVWINSASKVKVPSHFSENKRTVEMEGEAFFDIKKDPDNPFEVNVKGKKIKVFGTRFNVRSYADSKKIEATLEHGKIVFETGNRDYQVRPGQQIIYNTELNRLNLRKVDLKYYTSWKDGRIYMKKASFNEIVKIISIWYDYDVIYNKTEFTNVHFSGVIKHDKSVEHLMNLMQHSVKFDYSFKDSKIYIKSITK